MLQYSGSRIAYKRLDNLCECVDCTTSTSCVWSEDIFSLLKVKDFTTGQFEYFNFNLVFSNKNTLMYLFVQYLNDHNPSIPTAVLEVVGVDGNPLQWAERVSLYNANTSLPGGGNYDPMRWVGTVHPISTSVMELTARRSCLIIRTNQLASQHGFKLHVVIRPHLLQHQ